MKTCIKCNQSKELSEFSPSKRLRNGLPKFKDGYYSWCKLCFRVYKSAWKKLHPLEPKEVLPEGYKRCKKCNNVKILDDFPTCFALSKYGTFRCKDNRLGACRNCRANKRNAIKALRRIGNTPKDIQWKIKEALRHRLYISLKAQLSGKKVSAVDNLGCSIQELITYLESMFQEGMTWNNWGYGNDKWNIDHIIPMSSFDFLDVEQQKQAVHYTNLQPLWQVDNFKKSNRILKCI